VIEVDTITARLLQCNSSCTSILTPGTPVVVAETTVNTDGSYNFGSLVPAGCYSIRFFCSSCTSSDTDIGGIPCQSYTTNTIVPNVLVNCALCGTIQISGTVTCTAGTIGSVAVAVDIAPNGCTTSATSTIYVPVSSTGAYSFCIPSGSGIILTAVCASAHGLPFSTPTTCQTITIPTIINIGVTNCTCVISSTGTGLTTNVREQKSVQQQSSRLAGSSQHCLKTSSTKTYTLVKGKGKGKGKKRGNKIIDFFFFFFF
jgi:hypothetical protein